MKRPAGLLLRSALILFLVTIVIGILNGLDVWEPSHEMLLTHVHAGTLVDSPGIKRVSSPVLGVALMAAAYALIQSRRGQPSPA
ncbi:MAG: hypothetical protein ACR2JP_09235 [Acidimicrobiia bacterium]